MNSEEQTAPQNEAQTSNDAESSKPAAGGDSLAGDADALTGDALAGDALAGDALAGSDRVSVAAEEYEDLKKKAEERERYLNELRRTKADFDNFQKRVRKERPGWEEQAVRRFILDLLPVFDNFERALEVVGDAASAEGFEQGVLLTHQMMERVLHDHGVEEVLAEGETFNPELHEAMSQVEVVDRPTGAVAEVLEKGYRHRNTLLRPSKVIVATNVGDTKPSTDSSRQEAADDGD